jgi:hypothetical protein
MSTNRFSQFSSSGGEMTSIYRVEKTELPVMLFQADGSVMKGVVFLSSCTYTHIGQQTLMNLLEEKGNFFPFRSEVGNFCVTNKSTITHIRFEPPATEAENLESLGDKVEVQITFVGGEQLGGAIVIEMPEGRNRLYDFMNAVEGFFTLTTPEAHYLVNVDQIREVNPKN